MLRLSLAFLATLTFAADPDGPALYKQHQGPLSSPKTTRTLGASPILVKFATPDDFVSISKASFPTIRSTIFATLSPTCKVSPASTAPASVYLVKIWPADTPMVVAGIDPRIKAVVALDSIIEGKQRKLSNESQSVAVLFVVNQNNQTNPSESLKGPTEIKKISGTAAIDAAADWLAKYLR